jgi:hypothetical protein
VLGFPLLPRCALGGQLLLETDELRLALGQAPLELVTSAEGLKRADDRLALGAAPALGRLK